MTRILCRACKREAEIEAFPSLRFAVCRTVGCCNQNLHSVIGNNDNFNENYMGE